SIGAAFGLFLQRSNGTTLSTVARSNFDAVQKDGVHVEGVYLAGGGPVTFDNVYRDSTKQEGGETEAIMTRFSYVVVTTKMITDTTPTLVESLEPFIVPRETTIVLIQNGVGIEDEIQARWPDNLVLSCIAYVSARQTAPGRFVHTGGLQAILGPFHADGSSTCSPYEKERTDRFSEMCTLGGCNTRAEYNHVYLQAQRWTKIAMNASWNAVTTLADVDTAAYLAASPLSELLVRRIMREIILIARGLGIEIDPLEPGRVADMHVGTIKGIRNTSSSTRTDVKAGRALEYEVIWGYPLKQAKRLGIDVPALETVAILMEAIDARNRGKVKVNIK
ncbi:6-phosphogluconate dehydrogenase C-terminal domain-like protein, partial [Clavulina sp. PMI_390]